MANQFNPNQITDKSLDGSKLKDDITLGGGLKLTTNLSNLNGSYTTTLNVNNGFAASTTGNATLIGAKVGIGTAGVDSGYDVTVNGNTVIKGNLDVTGTLNYTSTEIVPITDNTILLNSNWTTAATEDAGLEVERGTYTNSKLYWDETNNYWSLNTPADNASAATAYRIIDQNYGDGRYMAKSNTSFSAQVSITTSTDNLLQLKQTGGGFNYIEFFSDAAVPGSYVRKAYAGMISDTVFAIKAEDAAGSITLDNNITVSGNITMATNMTVDGVDISAHAANATAHHNNANDPSATEKAALAGTNGTPGTTNKYVTNSDTRLTDQRTPVAHALIDTTKHTVSGLTTGHVIRASGATTYAFAQLSHSDLGSVTADQHHAQVHSIDGTDHTGTLGVGKGGTGATSLPAGRILYGDTTAVGASANLFWDKTNNRLGVGTISPSTPVNILNNINTSAENWMLTLQNPNPETNTPTAGLLFAVGDSQSQKGGIIFRRTASYGRGDMYFVNNNVADPTFPTTATDSAMVIKNTGNIGIGTISPSQKLDVAGNINTSGNITLSTANATVDGRDVSADGTKLDTLETIRSKRGRKAVELTSAVTQDFATTLTSMGLTGTTWGADNIVLVNLDGSLQIEDVDGTNQFDYSKSGTETLTFHFDIPVGSIIEIIVL